MKKQNYVPITLENFLNENKSIMLTRQYGSNSPVVVGSRAPLRNQILAYVAENVKVSRPALKKFMAGLNEGNLNPAAANMWIKRNEKFFIAENTTGVTTYKLSSLGKKLASRLMMGSKTTTLSEAEKMAAKKAGKDEKEYNEKALLDNDNDKDDEIKESRQERVQRIIEQINAKRSHKLYEEEDEETEEKEEEIEDETEVEEKDETDEDEAKEESDETETEEDELESDEIESEDDDRVEISEFVITVDDVASALAELKELGIDAQEVTNNDEIAGDEDFGGDLDAPVEGDDLETGDEDIAGDLDAPVEGEDDLDMSDEVGNFDFGGDIDGEPVEEAEEPDLDSELDNEDDELSMDDLDGEGDDLEAPIETDEPENLDQPEENAELDNLEEPAEGGEKQIKISAADWDKLKPWLEEKGVDINQMFGGDIEVEGEESEESVEDDINFDELEDLEPVKGSKDEDESEEHEEGETKEEEDKEEEEGDDDKKDGFQPGKKGVNPFPKKVNESTSEIYPKKRQLEMTAQMLQAEGYDIDFGFSETHAGIDHYTIVDNETEMEFKWMPKGFMRKISDSNDWGWCVVDNQEGNLTSFKNDYDGALEFYKKMLK